MNSTVIMENSKSDFLDYLKKFHKIIRICLNLFKTSILEI